jgi:hypothetical protein
MCIMPFQNLRLAICCLTILAATFRLGHTLLRVPPKAVVKKELPRLPASTDGSALLTLNPEPPAQEPTPPPAATRTRSDYAPSDYRPLQPKLPHPLTRADVNKYGERCIGQRVRWTGKWKSSQLIEHGRKQGSQHFFFGEGPHGDYIFDRVFIAEEPEPYRQSPGWEVLEALRNRFREETHKRFEENRKSGRRDPFRRAQTLRTPEEIREYERRRSILVTVTGTITRLETLIYIGEGKRHDVPVLKDITIRGER